MKSLKQLLEMFVRFSVTPNRNIVGIFEMILPYTGISTSVIFMVAVKLCRLIAVEKFTIENQVYVKYQLYHRLRLCVVIERFI